MYVVFYEPFRSLQSSHLLISFHLQALPSIRRDVVQTTIIATSTQPVCPNVAQTTQDAMIHAQSRHTNVQCRQQAAYANLLVPLFARLITDKDGQCCPRACPAPSAFLCPSSLGGGCCSVGSACLSGNSCSSTINTATVNTVSASPTGCTTGQFSCQPGAGGGCCNIGQTCTAIASQLLCVSGSSTSTNTAGLPTATGPTSPSGGSNGGLSSGAKAGIGVGVTLAALLIFGGLIAWFVVARRRRQRELAAKEQTPADGGAEMSNVSSPGAGSTGPDYFGAQPQPGPYTLNHAASASGMASYGPYSASQRGAVPISPQSPRDITTPVEIAGSGAASPGSAETESGTGLPGPHRGYFDPKPSDVKTAEPSPSDRVELP